MSSKSQSTGSTDNNQPTPTAHKSGMTRRDLLRRSAVGAATVGAVSTGAIRLDHSPVQNSQAIAPVVVAGAMGGSAALGWTVREAEIIGSDDPPEGTTASTLRSNVYDIANTRASTNKSTIIDNINISDGIGHSAWADGKFGAIESLNEQNTLEQVQNDGDASITEYEKTVLKNFLKTWNESCEELDNILSRLEDHPDTSVDLIGNNHSLSSDLGYSTGWDGPVEVDMEADTHEFGDGEEFHVHRICQEAYARENTVDTTVNQCYSPIRKTGNSEAQFTPDSLRVDLPDSEVSTSWMYGQEWMQMYDDITSKFDEVRDGLQDYVVNIYDDIQSGELDTTELLTPREQAELTAEDEDFPQAIADLQALNVAVDLEREAQVYLPDTGATLYGQLGYTGDQTLSTGDVNPDDKDGTIYLTYDVSQGEGEWSAYDEGIDGGVLTFTEEPFVETQYVIDTTAGETVEFTADDFQEDDDEWTVDLSDDLDDAITNVEQIAFYSEVETTQYETITLQDEFEIISFSDSEGNEYDETNFESSEPHTDDNYITEEEWQEQQERHEELIQQYEDAQGSGISIPGVEDVLDGEANGLIGIAVVGMVLVSAILSALNPLS